MVAFELDGVSFSLTPETAVALGEGSLDPDVAYMQGRLKVAGDMAAFYDLLPLAGSAPFKDALPAPE
jgi:predicted lipid carrier protein YhbT